MGVVYLSGRGFKILRALRAHFYLQPYHSKNPRSAPGLVPQTNMEWPAAGHFHWLSSDHTQ